jgi:chitodextrinase
MFRRAALKQRVVTLGAAGLLAAAAITVGLVTAGPAAAAPTICEKFGSTTVSSGRYVVQNNNWGDDTTQCIDVNQTGPGFSVTTASHNKATNGAPGSYPSIYYGCHYANCSSGSGLPVQASTSTFAGLSTSVSMTFPGPGIWDAAYDIWFDPTPRTDGQNTGAEIMVWLNKQGSIQPVGSQVGTATLNGATWNVWEGNIGWNVVSYVRQSATSSLNFGVNEFFSDAVNRGFAQRAWYLTSIQAGFEPWVGQTGLAVNSFSVTSGGGGGGGDTQAPSTPSNLTASGITSSAASLAWNGSTDNIGVSGYDVLRAPGTSGGTFSSVGTATGTSFSATGLSPSTSYRFQVRARDAAGNTSAVSNTVTVTTTSGGGGGGGGGCGAAYRIASAWAGAFQGEVAVSNTGTATLNGWTVTLTLATSITVTQAWGATFTQSGNTVTFKNMSYNGALTPGTSTTMGFIANTSGSSGASATSTCTSP